jgi:cupin fold WbuC family metalloprotein
MIALTKESPEVYYATEPLVAVGAAEVTFLKDRARENPRLRSRLCVHASPDDLMHEMMIVHHRECYVRPHRHRTNAEALHVIEGSAHAIVFDDDGAVFDHFVVSSATEPTAFYYRMPPQRFHMLVITSEWFVFHEITTGPFVRANTDFPDWAPDGTDSPQAQAYVRDVRDRIGLGATYSGFNSNDCM